MTKKTDTGDIAKRETASLESDNTEAVETFGTTGNTIFVFANLQNGQSFLLPDGASVTIKGFPVSKLVGADGRHFAGGKYGVTEVPADQWEQVMKIYGQMRIFKSGLVFSAPTAERGKAMARERGGLRHGYEPVDPRSNRAKTMPKTEE